MCSGKIEKMVHIERKREKPTYKYKPLKLNVYLCYAYS